MVNNLLELTTGNNTVGVTIVLHLGKKLNTVFMFINAVFMFINALFRLMVCLGYKYCVWAINTF